MNPAIQALFVIVGGVGGCIGYFYLSNLFLDKVLFPAKGPNAGVNTSRANMIRPWLFLMPAMVALGVGGYVAKRFMDKKAAEQAEKPTPPSAPVQQ